MRLTSIFLLLIGLPLSLAAAEDGLEGPTSTGQVSVKLTITRGIQVINLNDISLRVDRNGTDNVSFESQFCIRGKLGAGYRVSTSADLHDAVGFALVGNNRDTLNYQITFKSDLHSGVPELLTPDGKSRVYTVSDPSSDCEGGNNASITILFERTEIQTATSEEYNGTIYVGIEMV